MRSRNQWLLAVVVVAGVTLASCGKKDEENNNTNNNPQANPNQAKPVEFQENLHFHTDLRDRVWTEYNASSYDICVQRVKQGEREFVRVTHGQYGCQESLHEGTQIAELTLVGYRLLSKTGVEVGNVYQYSNAKNLTEFCTAGLKVNCQFTLVEERSTDQSVRKRIRGMNIVEAATTR